MATLISRKKVIPGFGLIPGSGVVEHCIMNSDVLGIEKEFSVYLPNGYDQNNERYPVIYLLHPAGGNHEIWISHGRLPEIADDAIRSRMALPMIIVMPDGSGSDEHYLGKHLGFFSVEGWDYEKYFNTELIPLIDSIYRTLPDKGHRSIVGASMGGEAAIAYAQKNPDIYGASCALSGILGHPEQSKMAKTDKDYAHSLMSNDPSQFILNATPENIEKLKSVQWYSDCGDNDFFIQGNIEFFQTMKSRMIPMEFRVRRGVHSWYYWITGLPSILQFISTVIERTG